MPLEREHVVLCGGCTNVPPAVQLVVRREDDRTGTKPHYLAIQSSFQRSFPNHNYFFVRLAFGGMRRFTRRQLR